MVDEIRDPIHGIIQLNDIERRLLDTEEVQRLRRIKQLGLTYLVYPSATHTRFEHSLGVMYLSGRIGDALQLSDETVQLLRLCALLHDVGHVPFSHTFEHITERFTNKPHEKVTGEIIKSSSISDILSDAGYNPSEITKILKDKKPYSEILNSDLDADRMDYLVRDSHYTGVAYGVIDLDRLIHTIKIHENQLVLTALPEAESMLRARSLMYPTVYEHHTARTAESMLSKAIECLIKTGDLDSLQLFKFDDIDLISTLRNSKGYPKEIIHRIDIRNLFKRALVLGKTELSKMTINRFLKMREEPKHINRVEKQIADASGLDQNHVILDIQEPIYPAGVNLKLLKEDKLYDAADMSTTIKTLKESQWDYWHVYVFCSEEHKKKVRKAAMDVLNLDIKATDQKKLL